MSQGILQKDFRYKGILKTLIISISLGFIASKLTIRSPYLALGTVVISLAGVWLIGTSLFENKARSILSKAQFLFFFPLIFLYITAVPKIGPLPLSPVFLFMGIYLLYALISPKELISSLRQSTMKLFLLLLICWIYQYIISLVLSSGGSLINMQLIEIMGIFCGITYFVKGNSERAIWATRILASVLIISMVWFVAEVAYRDLSLVRVFIYHSVLQGYGEKTLVEAVTYPNGLSQLLFLFGYQVSVAVPLTIMLFLIDKGKTWRVFWGIGSIVSLLAMIFAGERSVLLSAAIALTLFLYSRRQFKPAVIILTLSLLTVFIFSLVEIDVGKNLLHRVQDEESQGEGFARVKLQLIGLKVALQNPLGLKVTGGRWGDEALSAGADFDAWGGEEIAVHNGYLGRVIPYGWIFGALMAAVFFHLYKLMKSVSLFVQTNKERAQYAQAVSFCLIAVLIQASFHNSSLFNFNAVSVTIALLLSEWVAILAGEAYPNMKHAEGMQ